MLPVLLVAHTHAATRLVGWELLGSPLLIEISALAILWELSHADELLGKVNVDLWVEEATVSLAIALDALAKLIEHCVRLRRGWRNWLPLWLGLRSLVCRKLSAKFLIGLIPRGSFRGMRVFKTHYRWSQALRSSIVKGVILVVEGWANDDLLVNWLFLARHLLWWSLGGEARVCLRVYASRVSVIAWPVTHSRSWVFW